MSVSRVIQIEVIFISRLMINPDYMYDRIPGIRYVVCIYFVADRYSLSQFLHNG